MSALSAFKKISIHVHPVFWILAALIGWLSSESLAGTLVWVVVVFFSVLIHEYGHALTAIMFGQSARIELMGLGGVTYRNGTKLKLWKEFLVILNGPIAGFMLFLGASFLLGIVDTKQDNAWVYGLKITAFANLFWTILNLLPVYPLDGGKLFSLLMEGLFGLKGMKIALFLSMVFAALIGAAFFFMRQIFAGAIFMMLTFESYRNWRSHLSMTEQDQDEDIQTLLKSAEQQASLGNFDEAIKQFTSVREAARSGIAYVTANEYLAGILNQQGKYKEAYTYLKEVKDHLSDEALQLLQRLAFQTGELRQAIVLGNKIYQNTPTFESALINAFSHSLLGETHPAVGWLNCAIQDGLPNPKQVLEKKEFDPIREDPLFQELLHKAS